MELMQTRTEFGTLLQAGSDLELRRTLSKHLSMKQLIVCVAFCYVLISHYLLCQTLALKLIADQNRKMLHNKKWLIRT